MEIKMDKIYTVTTLSGAAFGDSRCVGFFHELDIAKEEVENNSMDIFETSYWYCVIEEVGPGFYNFPRLELWHKFRKDKGKYIPCEKPDNFKRICGFGIG